MPTGSAAVLSVTELLMASVDVPETAPPAVDDATPVVGYLLPFMGLICAGHWMTAKINGIK